MSAIIENKQGLFWYPGSSDYWWVPADWITYKFECFLTMIQGFIGLSHS